jgi:hypothetical protein
MKINELFGGLFKLPLPPLPISSRVRDCDWPELFEKSLWKLPIAELLMFLLPGFRGGLVYYKEE